MLNAFHTVALVSGSSDKISALSMLVSGSKHSSSSAPSSSSSSWGSVGTPDSTVNAMDVFRNRDGPYMTDAAAARSVEKTEINALALKRGTAPYEL